MTSFSLFNLGVGACVCKYVFEVWIKLHGHTRYTDQNSVQNTDINAVLAVSFL